ncbi:JAB domain-containing protein [Aquimarina algiphila]|nr:JAB domain-containing protein [Aquimarina algiphila]
MKSFSVGIDLKHNHPSSKLEPSDANKELIYKIKKVASFFDIIPLDHS